MKTTMLLLLVAILAFSCEDACPEKMRYEELQRNAYSLQTEIDAKQAYIDKQIEQETPWEDLVVDYDELFDLKIMKAVVEIEMETLERESRCF